MDIVSGTWAAMSRSLSFPPRDEDDRAAEVADWMAERATGRYLLYKLEAQTHLRKNHSSLSGVLCHEAKRLLCRTRSGILQRWWLLHASGVLLV